MLLLSISVLATVILAFVQLAESQPAGKVPRIGYLSHRRGPHHSDNVFLQGLRDLGYVEGKNIAIEYRFTDGKRDSLWSFAAELVDRKVDMIVTTTGKAAGVAKKITNTIPIVMIGSADAVGQGLVASLARPGGNVTGFTSIAPQLMGKRLELLKEAFPRVLRVAVFKCGSKLGDINQLQWRVTEAVARSLGVHLRSLDLVRLRLEPAFEAAIRERAEALLMFNCPRRLPLRQTVELAAKTRLPAMYPFSRFVDAGGLMAYGSPWGERYRRTAFYVDKILKGVKPAALPVEQPTKFRLDINLKTAKKQGLTIPPQFLARADRVIK